MNMQAMMQQAQKLQRDMLKIKEEINNKVFTSEQDLVKVEVKGTKELISVKLNCDEKLEKDDIEILEDMILIAVNDCMKSINKETEEKMGKFGNIAGML